MVYVSQTRVDELKLNIGSKINISHHFISVYGNTQQQIDKHWGNKGGFPAYQKYVLHIAESFPHIQISQDVWQANIPKTSDMAHLFL